MDDVLAEVFERVQGVYQRRDVADGLGYLLDLAMEKILGEAGDIRRFRSPAAFARHNGTAPVPASSGTGTGGPQRLNRGGNRQLNAALHRIAVVQARCHPGAAALLERRGQDKHETRKAQGPGPPYPRAGWVAVGQAAAARGDFDL